MYDTSAIEQYKNRALVNSKMSGRNLQKTSIAMQGQPQPALLQKNKQAFDWVGVR